MKSHAMSKKIPLGMAISLNMEGPSSAWTPNGLGHLKKMKLLNSGTLNHLLHVVDYRH